MEKYMEELKSKLAGFEEDLVCEIVADYEQHFIEGRLEGKSDSEIIADLGSIDDMISELKEIHSYSNDNTTHAVEDKVLKNDIDDTILNEEKYYESDNTQDNTSARSNCKTLVLDADIADVDVMTNNLDEIEVIYENKRGNSQSKKFKFYNYEKDDIFYVGVKKASRGFDLLGNFIVGAIKLKVKLPTDMKNVKISTKTGDVECTKATVNKIDIASLSSDITVSNLNASEVTLSTKAGDIELDNVKTHDLLVNATSGDVEAENISVTNNAKFSLLSGDANVKNTDCNIINIESRSGNIDCKNISYNYGKFDTGSGDVRMEVDRHKEMACKSGSGDVCVKLINSLGITLGVTTGCGDIGVRWAGKKHKCLRSGFYTFGTGDEKVTIKTGAGDINVSR